MGHAAIHTVHTAVIVRIAGACIGMDVPRQYQVHLVGIKQLLQLLLQVPCNPHKPVSAGMCTHTVQLIVGCCCIAGSR